MISVRIWATQNLVISMRSYPVKAVHEVREELAAGLALSPGGLLVHIAEKLIDNIEPVVEQLKEEADEFEEAVLTARDKLPAASLAEFRRTILILRRYILPQRDAMIQLQREGRALFDDEHTIHLRDTADRITRIAEELELYPRPRGRAAGPGRGPEAGTAQPAASGPLPGLRLLPAADLRHRPPGHEPRRHTVPRQGLASGEVGGHRLPGRSGVPFLKWRRWI